MNKKLYLLQQFNACRQMWVVSKESSNYLKLVKLTHLYGVATYSL